MTFILADAAGIVGAGTGVVLVVLAIIGLVVRFRPRFDAAIDGRRQAIRLKVSNKGRLEGRINGVSVLDSEDHEVPSEFASLPNGRFRSGRVAHGETRSLVIKAKKPTLFAEGVRVFVQWGHRGKKEIVPEQKRDISYYLEESDWPPAT